MRICHRWRQEETTERRGQSYTLRCITARDDRQIVRMAAMDHAATARITAQQIQSVTHHSVSSRTIRHRLQQSEMSARQPLVYLSLTGNTGVCTANSAINSGHGQRNGTTLRLLTNPN
ncbi:transposable element Tc1 transposase [Trichonephila clavipes]|nr:transposable element Tc1 transposase [Trichonephila clavipes]